LLCDRIAGTTEDMSRRKRIPENSKLTRDQPLAYARKQKPGERGDAEPAGEDDIQVKDKDVKSEAKEPAKDKKAEAKAVESKEAKATEPKETSTESKADEPTDKVPALDPVRAHVDTIGMPFELGLGAPPDMPVAAAPAIAVAAPEAPTAITAPIGSVEDPTLMPGPREIPGGSPTDQAAAPGVVPAGDSRSLRRQDEFALIYRRGNAVISRFGTVGTRGQWRVVEYPTSAAASHAYAKESSRFVSEGFSDYRE
jgi:hypothetical protein